MGEWVALVLVLEMMRRLQTAEAAMTSRQAQQHQRSCPIVGLVLVVRPNYLAASRGYRYGWRAQGRLGEKLLEPGPGGPATERPTRSSLSLLTCRPPFVDCVFVTQLGGDLVVCERDVCGGTDTDALLAAKWKDTMAVNCKWR